MAGRTSDEEARRTRRRIVAHAADVASEQGLGALSLGKLATELSVSKAGVVGQFGSKQGLQLAVLDHAVRVFVEVVWTPAEDAAPGLARLESVCESWTRYIADPPLRGGCFLSAAAFEWDSRPGTRALPSRSWTSTTRTDSRGFEALPSSSGVIRTPNVGSTTQ